MGETENKSLYSKMAIIITIVMITAFLGELKIVVFSSSFRFGLGGAAFFFLLLFYKEISYPLIGLITGLIVTLFRVGLDFSSLTGFDLSSSLIAHGPIIGFYFVFAMILYLGKAQKLFDFPFYLGVLGAFTDGVANIVELLIRSRFTTEPLLTPINLEYVVIIAILRSFFVVGLFNLIYTKQMKAVYKEQRSKLEHIQLITSGLYVEGFYLKKLLNDIENVTAKGFDLYQNLKGYDEVPPNIKQLALSISQEVHEVKKDNQRVLAGLEKIITQEENVAISTLTEAVDLVVRANQKYAIMLNKNIEFLVKIEGEILLKKTYPFVVILNNLVANAVEGIEVAGNIEIKVLQFKDILEIQVIDNGPGIRPEDLDIIFTPGFTTKFDDSGKASTGIGLSHVKSMVSKLDGEIDVYSKSGRTIFIVSIPLAKLKEER